MMISKLKVKKLLAEAIDSAGMHMTMGGGVVPFGCPECVSDIEDRITDVSYSRDACHRGTAARAHYNGVLSDLRMKKRAAIKTPEPMIHSPSVDDDFDDRDQTQALMTALLDEDEDQGMTESQLRAIIRNILAEDVRKRGDEYCAYVDDKLTKKEKENNPKKYKGKKVGSVQRTKSGKIRMKARACYKSKKKANNAMAAAMMG